MNKRSPIFVLLISLVTFGIYAIYWLYITRKELRTRVQGRDQSWPVKVLFAPYVLILIGFILYSLARNSGPTVESSPVDILLFLIGAVSIIGIIVLPFIWFYKFTKLVTAATPSRENNLYLIWVVLVIFSLPIIWPMIVQAHLNSDTETEKLSSESVTSPSDPTLDTSNINKPIS